MHNWNSSVSLLAFVNNFSFSFNDKPLPHSLNDTLKNIKNGHGSLKFFVSNYRDASFDTMKSIHLFSFQIIQNKITLIKYSTKSPTTWRVVKCRSTSVPLFFSDVLEYMKVFELFVFLHVDSLVTLFDTGSHTWILLEWYPWARGHFQTIEVWKFEHRRC